MLTVYRIYIYIYVYIYILSPNVIWNQFLFFSIKHFFFENQENKKETRNLVLLLYGGASHHTHTHTQLFPFYLIFQPTEQHFPFFFLSISVSILSNIIILCMFVFNALVYYPLPNLIYNEPNCNTTRKLKS